MLVSQIKHLNETEDTVILYTSESTSTINVHLKVSYRCITQSVAVCHSVLRILLAEADGKLFVFIWVLEAISLDGTLRKKNQCSERIT